MYRGIKPRHILHIISSLERGGAQAVLYNLVRGLSDRGYTQTVIYFHGGPYVEQFKQLGIAVHQVRGALRAYDPLFWWRIYFLIRTLQPDILHASLWAACFVSRIVARVCAIPMVNAVHALLDHHGAVRTWCDRMTVTHADRFIAVSSGVQASLTWELSLRHDDAVLCIPNGVDIAHIHAVQRASRAHRNRYGLSGEQFVIGAVGRLVPVKQFDQLIVVF